MAGGTFDTLTAEQKLRLTLQKDVKAICEEACNIMNVEVHSFAVDLITELVMKRLQVYAVDLEQFARHAKRSNINTEDVKLLVRRNQSIKSHVLQFIENNASSKESKKKRTTIASAFAANQSSASNTKNKANDDSTKNNKASTAKKKDNENPESTIDLT